MFIRCPEDSVANSAKAASDDVCSHTTILLRAAALQFLAALLYATDKKPPRRHYRLNVVCHIIVKFADCGCCNKQEAASAFASQFLASCGCIPVVNHKLLLAGPFQSNEGSRRAIPTDRPSGV